MTMTFVSMEAVRREAKELSQKEAVSYGEALERVSNILGFEKYKGLDRKVDIHNKSIKTKLEVKNLESLLEKGLFSDTKQKLDKLKIIKTSLKELDSIIIVEYIEKCLESYLFLDSKISLDDLISTDGLFYIYLIDLYLLANAKTPISDQLEKSFEIGDNERNLEFIFEKLDFDFTNSDNFMEEISKDKSSFDNIGAVDKIETAIAKIKEIL